jgi:hypothetical protein
MTLMLHKKTFIISIGDKKTIVSLHDGNCVIRKIIISSIDNENRPKLTTIFSDNKSASIYIILDSTNQSYNRKAYPLISKSDFNKVAQRDLNKDAEQDKSFLQSYIGVKNKLHNRWDCTFVSSPNSPEIELWTDFLLTLPNHLIGIYMLPLEINNFVTKLFNATKSDHKIQNNKDVIISITTNNKISGVRQVVFLNNSIVFTRVINYNFEDPKFYKNYESDAFRSYEYLLILFPKIKPKNFVIINILSDDVINKIKGISTNGLEFINYSPHDIAKKLGIFNAVPKNNDLFSDTIIANCFANSRKKILKYLTPKIKERAKLRLAYKSICIFNTLVCLSALFLTTKIYNSHYKSNQTISNLVNIKSRLTKEFMVINNSALEGTKDNTDKDLANRIIDFGKINDIFFAINNNALDVFDKLAVTKKYNVLISSVNYNLLSFDPKAQEISLQKTIFTIKGQISDQSGDVEVLFKKFDALNLETKNKFLSQNVLYSSISKNVDFNKQYYSFPIEFTLTNK